MVTLQDDILELYNSLVMFSDNTVKTNFPKPIEVFYEKESKLLVLSQSGKSVRLSLPNYYCFALTELTKHTYLLPEDYDYLMSGLQQAINSGDLLKDRVCLSPENYGFDIFRVKLNEFDKGPDILCSVRFVSGTSWLFKLLTKRKYKL